MSKDLPFFKFFIADWMLGRIQRLDLKTKGGFTDLICMYWHNGCQYLIEDAKTDIGADVVKILINAKIIKKNGEYLVIDFLDLQLAECEEISVKRSKAGSKGGKAKAKQVLPIGKQIEADKKREDKDKSVLATEVFKQLDMVWFRKFGQRFGLGNAVETQKAVKGFAHDMDMAGQLYVDVDDFKGHCFNKLKQKQDNIPHEGATIN